MEEESRLIKLMANFPACDLREAYFQRAIDILEANLEQVKFVERDGFFHAIEILKYHQKCICRAYVSGRPCFDKPAGVPILHGETL